MTVKKSRIMGIMLPLLFQLSLLPVSAQQEIKAPKRLKRSESFLGIHFDFHAGPDCTEIGKSLTREMLETVIDRVQPDYIQCDGKGHPGLSSYPTKVGNPAPGFIRDPLMIWREVTAERGVALYLHYSGVIDQEAVNTHPEWARVNKDGETTGRITSVYSPYVDELLIPQLKELRDFYEVDGMWVDGECWGTERDYRGSILESFRKQTGIESVPRSPEDPCWFEFSEFCREGFREYLNHYVTELHKHDPEFQICSNWAYTSVMPEPVTIDVDFISGDYSSTNSVNSARSYGRSMVYQGKPWDLMAWSFARKSDERGSNCTKSIPQLKQEAAIVLALGGGFQAYFKQKRDGSIYPWQMKLMEEVAKFCRERQSVCHRAQPVPQIGLIFSGKAFYRVNTKLFAAWFGEADPFRGLLQNLVESQHVVDMVMEHHLTGRFQDYPLLIWPEWEYIDPNFKKELLDYVDKGGNLLVIGPKAAALFKDELGVRFVGETSENINGLEHEGWLARIPSLYQKVELEQGTRPFGRIYPDYDLDGPFETAGSIKHYGRGRIAAVYLNLGEKYKKNGTSVNRKFLSSLVQELFPEPMVEVKGSRYVDVTLNRIDGKLALNLVNTSGPHDNENILVFDEILPVGPLTVSIKTAVQPKRITLEPIGRELDYRYENGKIFLILPSLEIHEIILVE